MHTHAYVETEPKEKLVEEENVLKYRWLSGEESAAVRGRTCQRVLLVTEGQPGEQSLMSFPAQQLQLCKLGWSPHSQLPFCPHEFCGHTATLRLGIWMSAWPAVGVYSSFGNRSTGFAHGKKWINSCAGAIWMYSLTAMLFTFPNSFLQGWFGLFFCHWVV